MTTFATAGIAAVGALAAGSGGIGPGGGDDPQTTSASQSGTFPVKGRVTWGDGIGAGRNHQGQDLMAKCGKRVVSAYPGRVQLRDYHGSAGNYVVIDGKRKLEDTVYMHLSKRAKVRKGQRVRAGQTIGRVGTTGNSSACHLHFEIWSNPGYYEGGKPVEPEPYLRSWKRKSKR